MGLGGVSEDLAMVPEGLAKVPEGVDWVPVHFATEQLAFNCYSYFCAFMGM